MPDIIGIRFRKAGKVYYFDPIDIAPEAGSLVVVETAKGVEIGEVAYTRRFICDNAIARFLPLVPILRIASDADVLTWEGLKDKAHEAYKVCQEKIQLHRLNMKLLTAEYTFDEAKLIFQFAAEGRVDFRGLVRDLAYVFKTRIELRQVGVRDEAKMIGGLGGCGRELCCCNFLGDFLPVSVKMARDQNISVNPNKMSGVCGRLLCCLNFEVDDTGLMKGKTMDLQTGSFVMSGEDPGTVMSINSKQRTAKVRLENGLTVEVSLDELLILEEKD